jgi:hypothetical protein
MVDRVEIVTSSDRTLPFDLTCYILYLSLKAARELHFLSRQFDGLAQDNPLVHCRQKPTVRGFTSK